MTSSDLKNHFSVIKGPRASFRSIICLGLKIFKFWPKMTHHLDHNSPNLRSGDLVWPRKPLFLNRWSLSFILVYDLTMFENDVILTPNNPKCPQVTPTPNFDLSDLYLIISFYLSYVELWSVACVTRYHENKAKPEMSSKTGSRYFWDTGPRPSRGKTSQDHFELFNSSKHGLSEAPIR